MSNQWWRSCMFRSLFSSLIVAGAALPLSTLAYQPGGARGGSRPAFIPEDYNDKQHMMDQLGIKALRPGKSGSNQTGEGFDEATANKWLSTLPDLMTMNDGTKVTTPEQWAKRRAEIAEDFAREVYGRIPPNVPAVTWELTDTTEGASGEIPTITKTLIGRIDNSAFPEITVNIRASFTVPANATGPVPMLIEFGGGFGRLRGFGRRGGAARGGLARGGPARGGGPTPWTQQAISHGWGYGFVNPGSIQADAGGNALRQGIIGLTNKGEPRKPEDWGALRAWQWGVSRLIDYFEANPDAKVDPKKVGIEGVSRYGKAALVTGAFEPRTAVAFVASSGAGGAKLYRRDFGEAVENLTGGGYYWFAGNYIKYGASEATFGSKNAADLPVDSHQLIALCAPRLCFVSYGVEPGDPKWVDARGSFMAAILAGPAYRLLGKKDLGVSGNFLTEPLPPVNQLIGGDLAWRQHSGGHTSVPNFPTFFEWVRSYIPAPPLPANQAATFPAVSRTDANSILAHEQLVAKAKSGSIDLYFLGDSITRRWGSTDPQWSEMMANWKQNFFGWNAANFGWGADRIQNMLWRIQNGELDGVNPKVIVILAGTNDVGNRSGNDDKIIRILRGYRALVATCRERAPQAKIILTAIFPRNDNRAVLPEIRRINEEIATLADGESIFYLNVNDQLADSEGALFDGITVDRLHLSAKGYQVWADGLRPLLTRFLGPPGQTDHAPPATGDPSIARPAASPDR